MTSDFPDVFLSVQSLDISKSMSESFNQIKPWLPIDGIYVNIFQPEAQSIRTVASVNGGGVTTKEKIIKLDEEMCSSLLNRERKEITIINDVQQDSVTAWVLSHYLKDAKSVILLRLIIDNISLGVVGFYSYQLNSFSMQHVRQLKVLQKHFAIITALELKDRGVVSSWYQDGNSNSDINYPSDALNIDISSPSFLGTFQGLKDALDKVNVVSKINCSVMINGESGVGKELIVDAIHNQSNRKHMPLVKVNCGAIAESIVESELFGHEQGAFTGAFKRRCCLNRRNHLGAL